MGHCHPIAPMVCVNTFQGLTGMGQTDLISPNYAVTGQILNFKQILSEIENSTHLGVGSIMLPEAMVKWLETDTARHLLRQNNYDEAFKRAMIGDPANKFGRRDLLEKQRGFVELAITSILNQCDKTMTNDQARSKLATVSNTYGNHSSGYSFSCDSPMKDLAALNSGGAAAF